MNVRRVYLESILREALEHNELEKKTKKNNLHSDMERFMPPDLQYWLVAASAFLVVLLLVLGLGEW